MHYHFVRECVLFGEVELQYVSTDRQTAEILGLHHLEKTEDELETTNSDESQN